MMLPFLPFLAGGRVMSGNSSADESESVRQLCPCTLVHILVTNTNDLLELGLHMCILQWKCFGGVADQFVLTISVTSHSTIVCFLMSRRGYCSLHFLHFTSINMDSLSSGTGT